MSNSKTLVEIQDSTTTEVGVDGQGRMYVRIGGVGEHQIEIRASVSDMLGVAARISGRAAGYVHEVEHEVARWVSAG